MVTVQGDILKAFYDKLAKSKEFDKAMIDAVRTLLGSDKKTKADDLVAVLAKGTQEGRPVIQIQSITIRELRGVRELTIEPEGKSFVNSITNDQPMEVSELVKKYDNAFLEQAEQNLESRASVGARLAQFTSTRILSENECSVGLP